MQYNQPMNKIESLFKFYNRNIAMFTELGNLDQVAELKAELELVNRCNLGEMLWDDLPYRIREHASPMPSWATYGT